MATGQETEDGSRLLASFPKNGRGEEVQVRAVLTASPALVGPAADPFEEVDGERSH